ncbi:MAG TPA: hypothetical protein VEY92_08345 [Pseudoxanthomonas sp.]|nr:hypothetical protein [Pseudoxanthomonas sp.]
MGAFDDLIPGGKAKAGGNAKPSRGGSFDDLVPQGAASQQAAVEASPRLSDEQWQAERDKLAQEGTGEGFWGNAVAGYGRALPVLASGLKQIGLGAANRTGASLYGGLKAVGLGGAADAFARNVGAPINAELGQTQ